MKKRTAQNKVRFKGKIKTEHTIIKGLFELLLELASVDEIQSIIPGRIRQRTSSVKQPNIKVTTRTSSGLKALGKCAGSSQELFIVTNKPDIVKDKISLKEVN